jgi:hypothetical protein
MEVKLHAFLISEVDTGLYIYANLEAIPLQEIEPRSSNP